MNFSYMMDNSRGALSSENIIYIEELYQKYLINPRSVDPSWQSYFDNLPSHEGSFASFPDWSQNIKSVINTKSVQTKDQGKQSKQEQNSSTASQVDLQALELLNAFRFHGHKIANIDPLELKKPECPQELDISSYGISNEDLHKNISSSSKDLTLGTLYQELRNTYCSSIGYEFMYVETTEEREWLTSKIENKDSEINSIEKEKIFDELLQASMFEEYLHTKFPGAKRFSIEGAEGTVVALNTCIHNAAMNGVKEAVLGMAHRGRLVTLTQVMKKPYHAMFFEFKGGTYVPDSLDLPGDVKYHAGFSSDFFVDDKKIHLSLTPNPSHLEIVNPVVAGRTRAKQDLMDDKNRYQALAILIHGDAALAGQGSVMETLALANTDGYSVGGALHIVINNQVGFTTDFKDARSSRYCTDIAKMISAPVFHVNGDDPEAIAHVTKIALEYKIRFKKDVFIDIVCYRKYGHNEGDEPMFTQPVMYNKIHKHSQPYKIYFEKLLREGVISQEALEKKKKDFKSFLDKEFDKSQNFSIKEADWLKGDWQEYSSFLEQDDITVKTGISEDSLKTLGEQLVTLPKDFAVNYKIQRLVSDRKKSIDEGKNLDWGTAESLAYASLIDEGFSVRITGEDVKRGTFAHRHAAFFDQISNVEYSPLRQLARNKGTYFEIYNSILSELGVLGFEYGYSYTSPKTLTVWEAQYGDFANSAQMVIDQFIFSGKAKWLRMSGLVMLLPHGYEGQGPEHTSARLERYLQMCADDNVTIANCTTASSIFHLLRRQMHRRYKCPLIVMSPKVLLRHKGAASDIADFTSDTSFKMLIPDDLNCSNIKKVLFCSGKVYYDLLQARTEGKHDDIALIRLEQLYPFPAEEVKRELEEYNSNVIIGWCQEEHKNMGAWQYMKSKFEEEVFEKNERIIYFGRKESSSPAAGYAKLHNKEQIEFITQALK